MELSKDIFNLLLALLPGLVASQIFYSLLGIYSKEIGQRVVDSLIFFFLISLFSGLFYEWKPWLRYTEEDGIKLILTSDKMLILLNLGLVFIIPVFGAWLWNNDLGNI